MLDRIVSIVLIAAILACPAKCGKGLSHHSSCCPEQESSQLQSANPETDCCCCKNESPEGKIDQPPAPFGEPPPCELSCQGVCGGAIIENRCGVDAHINFCQLLPDAPELVAVSQLTDFCTHLGDHFLHGGGNHGRSLRTLHLSFLC